MAVKTTGVEWKRFYTDPEFWPDGVYHDDEEILVDGNPCDLNMDLGAIPDSALVTIEGGIVFGTQDEPSLPAYFNAWRRGQSTTSFVVQIDKPRAEEAKAAIRAMGGKVI